MELRLNRGQKSSMMGKAVFILDAKAGVSDEEQKAIKKYKLGDQYVYQKESNDSGSGLLGAASRLTKRMMNMDITVNDLVGGKRVECKDILEMIAAEEQLKEACLTFKAILDAALHFGGEEVIQL